MFYIGANISIDFSTTDKKLANVMGINVNDTYSFTEDTSDAIV